MDKVIKLEKIDGKLCLTGALTFNTVNSILKTDLFTNGQTTIVDLAAVKHSDSSGLALLIQWFREAQARSEKIQFVNVPQKMMALAKVSNLDKVLPFVSH